MFSLDARARTQGARPGTDVTGTGPTSTGRPGTGNEDAVVARSPVFAVADGMGDGGAGSLASACVVAELELLADSAPLDPDRVVAALRRSHEAVLTLQNQLGLVAASTVAGAVGLEVEGQPYWMIFNVGDSRVYRVTGVESRRLVQVSVDHTRAQELVDEGRISRLEAMVHPDRTVLTRAVGMRQGEFEADFWLLPMVLGERLLVCSDGLLRDGAEVAAGLVAKGRRPAHQTAGDLLEVAVAGGNSDDVSVVVVDVLAEAVEDQTTIPDLEMRR